jgi:hypothetical protein
MISPFRLTNQQIAEHLRDRQRRERARRRVDLPIRKVDRVIAECEELMLVGRKRVPLGMEERLRRLAAALPAPVPELHAGVTIVHLMDQLFSVQGRLLGHRVDRTAYPDADAPR